MNLNYWILAGVWAVSLLLVLFIPKDRRRIAVLAFLFKQLLTAVLGHIVVEFNMLTYPVRELSDINRTSFTYEFLAYPMVCAIFNVYYPTHRSRLWQVGYYVLFTTVLTVPELLIERYTDLIRYIHWNWFWTWGTIFMTFAMTRIFCVVFFKTLKEDPIHSG
jgi:hypothetical protein